VDPADPHGNAVDEGERLRVLCKHGGKHAANGQDDGWWV